MAGQKLTNSTGTSNSSFSIDEMVIEYIYDGVNDGARLSFPGYSPVYIRALNPNVATKWINGTTAPADAQGNNGDYFLNSVTGQIYFKANNLWTVIASMIGPQGPQGVPGDPGPAGPTGPTGPIGPSAAIASASDVTLTNLEDGHLITWSSSQGKFVNIPKQIITDGGNV